LTPTGGGGEYKQEKSSSIKPKDSSVPNRQTRTISPISRPTGGKPKLPSKIEKVSPKLVDSTAAVDETPKWSNYSLRTSSTPNIHQLPDQRQKVNIVPEYREIHLPPVNDRYQNQNRVPSPQFSPAKNQNRIPSPQFSPTKNQNGHTYFERPELVEEDELNEGDLPKPETITQSKASLPEIEEISPKKLERQFSNNKHQLSFKDEHKDRDSELDLQVKSLEQTNKNLSEQLQFSNKEYLILNQDYDELKQQYNILYADIQKKTITDDKKNDKRAEFELGIYKEKVQALQKELEDLRTNNLSKRPELPHSQTSLDNESPKAEEYKQTISKLINELSDVKKKLTDAEAAHAKEIEKNKITISELTGGINKIKREVDQKDHKIESLEAEIQEFEENMTQLKQELIKLKLQPDISHSQNSIESETHQMLEEKYKQNIRDLAHENLELKKKLDESKRYYNDPVPLSKEPKTNPNYENVLMQKYNFLIFIHLTQST